MASGTKGSGVSLTPVMAKQAPPPCLRLEGWVFVQPGGRSRDAPFPLSQSFSVASSGPKNVLISGSPAPGFIHCQNSLGQSSSGALSPRGWLPRWLHSAWRPASHCWEPLRCPHPGQPWCWFHWWWLGWPPRPPSVWRWRGWTGRAAGQSEWGQRRWRPQTPGWQRLGSWWRMEPAPHITLAPGTTAGLRLERVFRVAVHSVLAGCCVAQLLGWSGGEWSGPRH